MREIKEPLPDITGLECVGYHPQEDGTALIEWSAPTETQNRIAAWCLRNNYALDEFLMELIEAGIAGREEAGYAGAV